MPAVFASAILLSPAIMEKDSSIFARIASKAKQPYADIHTKIHPFTKGIANS